MQDLCQSTSWVILKPTSQGQETHTTLHVLNIKLTSSLENRKTYLDVFVYRIHCLFFGEREADRNTSQLRHMNTEILCFKWVHKGYWIRTVTRLQSWHSEGYPFVRAKGQLPLDALAQYSFGCGNFSLVSSLDFHISLPQLETQHDSFLRNRTFHSLLVNMSSRELSEARTRSTTTTTTSSENVTSLLSNNFAIIPSR